jgi:8-oxo-dGTP pyrophosphatase MutT (NUDIX family)
MPLSLSTVQIALERTVTPVVAPKRAAVALILTPEFDVIFIRRAEYPGDPWSGHIAFPGGRVERSDRDARSAAERETREELGFDLSNTQYLGALDHVAPVGGLKPLAIEPFVYWTHVEPLFSPNNEVAQVFRVPLTALQNGIGRGRMTYAWMGQSVELPCIDFHEARLWGLTLRIVDDLLHRLDGRGTGLERSP